MPISAPYRTYQKSPHNNFWLRLYNFLCLFLNSGVTESELLKDVKKWSTITVLKSKLRSSNPFRNATLTHEDRRLNCGRIAAKIARFKSVNSENIERKFSKFVHDVAQVAYCHLPFNLLKRIYDRRFGQSVLERLREERSFLAMSATILQI